MHKRDSHNRKQWVLVVAPVLDECENSYMVLSFPFGLYTSPVPMQCEYLPTAYVVWEKVMFLHSTLCHSIHSGGGWVGRCVQGGCHTSPSPRDTVKKRSVHILLECILVYHKFCFK